MTVVAMLDDPEVMLCVLRELRRRHGAWPEAASLYAGPWVDSDVGRGASQLRCLPGVNTERSIFASVVEEKDKSGWKALVWLPGPSGVGVVEFGPFDTAAEAKQEAERALLEGGEVQHILHRFPWTPEDDIEWPMPAPPRGAPTTVMYSYK
jgi:hypothetical protein